MMWNDAVGYEGLYAVSSQGEVMSLRDNHIMTPVPDKDGYLNVCLTKGGKSISLKVHRLVAQAFIKNPLGKPQVNHKDENKANNTVDNLEWVTAKENNNYGTRNARLSISKRNKYCKKVSQYDLSGNFIKVWQSFNEVYRQEGYDTGLLVKVCQGRKLTAYGYKWRYAI